MTAGLLRLHHSLYQYRVQHVLVHAPAYPTGARVTPDTCTTSLDVLFISLFINLITGWSSLTRNTLRHSRPSLQTNNDRYRLLPPCIRPHRRRAVSYPHHRDTPHSASNIFDCAIHGRQQARHPPRRARYGHLQLPISNGRGPRAIPKVQTVDVHHFDHHAVCNFDASTGFSPCASEDAVAEYVRSVRPAIVRLFDSKSFTSDACGANTVVHFTEATPFFGAGVKVRLVPAARNVINIRHGDNIGLFEVLWRRGYVQDVRSTVTFATTRSRSRDFVYAQGRNDRRPAG